MSSMEVPLLIGLEKTKIDSVFLIWPDNTFQSITLPKEFSENYSKKMLQIITEEVKVKEVKIAEGEIKLDPELTEELKNEGIARDVIRAIQDARKGENLSPTEKIRLVLNCSKKIKEAIESFEQMIKSPTQVIDISYSSDMQTNKISIEGEELSLSIVK